MAGIGFTLKKLTEKNNIAGLFAAGFYSIFIACGPWLFTIITLSFIMIYGLNIVSAGILQEFQIILVYNFSFSYIFLGFYSLVISRYVSDKIFENKFNDISDVFYGSLLLVFFISISFVSIFYFTVAKMSLMLALSAIINFAVLSCIWHASIFMTVMKEYRMISTIFLLSLVVAVFTSLYLGYKFKLLGLINGYTLGLSIITVSLYIFFYCNFDFKLNTPFRYIKFYFENWKLILCGILCNAGIWVDKWLMWLSPNSFTNNLKLTCDLDYSNAMFLASLSIVPSLAFFLFGSETLLDKELLNLFNSIRNKASYQQILVIHKNMIKNIFNNLLLFMIIQGTFSITCLMYSRTILAMLRIPPIQLYIFDYGILGSFYQFFTFYLIMMLFYFNRINSIIIIYATFIILNSILTLISIRLGYGYYGLGYFIASIITFIITGITTTVHLKKLIYHIFITNNS